MAEMRNDAPRQGTLSDLVTGLLDRGYNGVVSPVLRSVASSTNDPNGLIQTRLRELEVRAGELAANGEGLSPRDPILRALLADLDDVMGRNVGRVDGVSGEVQATGTSAAGTIQRQMALGGMTDAQARALGVVWNAPDPDAVASLVGYAESSAWEAMLRRDFQGLVVGTVRNQAIRGASLGWGPLRTAREIRRITESMPAYQANNLMRTLQLTSYRDGTRVHQQANVGIISQVVRIATLDDRTCLSCIALHGDVIWDSEENAGEPIPRVNEHHSGRCTAIVRTRGRSITVRTGEEWFASLPEERRRRIAGEANFEALQAGAVTLRDFSVPYTDDVFGEMLREASLSGILGDGANQFYRRNR